LNNQGLTLKFHHDSLVKTDTYCPKGKEKDCGGGNKTTVKHKESNVTKSLLSKYEHLSKKIEDENENMLKDLAKAAVSNGSRFVYDKYFADIFNGTDGYYPVQKDGKRHNITKSSDFMAAFVGFALSELGDKTFLCVLLLTLLWADIRTQPAAEDEQEEEDKDENEE
jgi:hypothetical protein